MTDPRIGVAIVTRDRRNELLRTVARLRALPERPRIAVVDNGSRDGSAEAVRNAGGDVIVLAAGSNLGAAGRNVGVRMLGRPYVAFADDDSWWAPGALAAAADLLDAHPRLGLVQARILVGPEERIDPVCESMRDSPLPPTPAGPALLGFVACGAAVRAAAFLDAGGFGAGIGGEEALLAADLATAGWQMAYADHIVAHHHPSPVRDPARRHRRVALAALSTALRRRPTGVIARAAAGVLRRPLALPEALTAIPWALAQRRPPAPLPESQHALLATRGR